MSDELKNKIAENLKPALVRAIRTFIEVGIASIGGAVVFEEVNWLFVLSASGLAALSASTRTTFGHTCTSGCCHDL